jgi:hypothetical protein
MNNNFDIVSFPPPIYRLDKVNVYLISKLHHYLTKAKEVSKDVFDEEIFTIIFLEDEIKEAKAILLDEGKRIRHSIEPLRGMKLARSVYGYSEDPEVRELEEQFFKFYIISLEKHLLTNQKKFLDKPDEVKKVKIKPIKPKKEFKDFFSNDVDIEIIKTIQNEFKDFYGKKMACLIYLLESDFKMITYSLDSKNDSRKHFVESLTNKTIAMQGINKFFETYTYKLNIVGFEKDKDYTNTKEKLSKAIKN